MTLTTILKRGAALLLLICAAVLLSPAYAQDSGDGRGVVRFMTRSLDGAAALPFPTAACYADACELLPGLLMPTLFDLDPATGALLGASESRAALAQVVPSDFLSDEITLALDPSRLWSDGTPITAHDVLLSLILLSPYGGTTPYGASLEQVAGVRFIDDHSLALRFAATDAERANVPLNGEQPTPTCDDLPRAGVPVFPADVVVPGFRDFVDGDPLAGESASLAAWRDALFDTARLVPRSDAELTLTGGSYRWWDQRDGAIRLVPADGAGAALELSPRASGGAASAVDAFIAGETNVLLNAPVAQRAALRTLTDSDARNFQIAEPPGSVSLIILLNLADPARPLPAFHPATGDPLDQGAHPVFGDVRVRRAFALALDVTPIIDGVLQRSARPLAGLFPPASWAYDPSLAAPETNLAEAERLLDEAGWVENMNGRVCRGCGTAEDGASMHFGLGADRAYTAVGEAIIAQWRRLGADIYPMGDYDYALKGETFDAYLVPVGGNPYEDADPDRWQMLAPYSDMLVLSAPAYPLRNYNSYSNPEVTRLLDQARTLPGCDLTARAALYHQIERILQRDVPFIPVVAPNEFYAAAPGVIGFAPRSGDPLWNVESWVVTP